MTPSQALDRYGSYIVLHYRPQVLTLFLSLDIYVYIYFGMSMLAHHIIFSSLSSQQG